MLRPRLDNVDEDAMLQQETAKLAESAAKATAGDSERSASAQVREHPDWTTPPTLCFFLRVLY